MLASDFPALLPLNSPVEPEFRREIALTKRFLEYWSADPAFRQALPGDAQRVARAAGLEADPQAIRQLWALDPQDPVHQQPPTPEVVRYRAFTSEKLEYRTFLRNAFPGHHRGFQAWRERQIRRCFSQLGPTKGDSLVHASLAAELTEGCSVGCWFCGISALKLAGLWSYTPEHAELWNGVLGSINAQLGEAAARGFCYWATDPLDNPDYERFCLDFHARLGRFPQTTTAQPLRDPARFRRLHQLSRQHGNEIDRFSVLSLGVLKKIFAEYSAEELLFVEMMMQMDGAYAGKAFAGKARDKVERWRKATGGEIPPDEATSTIACVSGLLLRMPERSFELISPCRADSKWPNGYRIHARRNFQDAQDFANQFQQVLDSLSERLPVDQPLRLRSDLECQNLEDGFILSNHYFRHRFKNDGYQAMAGLGAGLAQGGRSGLELALSLESQSPLQETMHVLNRLFCDGMLDDEP